MLEAAPLRDPRSLPVQLRDRILDSIRAGELGPGDQVPPEVELAQRFSVGRSTVREALRILELDGVIAVRRGRGRYVSPLALLRAERPVTEFESVTEMLAGLGYRVRNRVLRLADAVADVGQAEALGIARGAPIVLLERLRLHGEEPLIHSVNAIERSVIPGGLDDHDWSGSVIALLGSLGARVVSSAATISAARLPRPVRPLVPGHAAAPWLRVVETCITDDGRPVLRAEDLHRADVFAFHVLRRRSAGAPAPTPSSGSPT